MYKLLQTLIDNPSKTTWLKFNAILPFMVIFLPVIFFTFLNTVNVGINIHFKELIISQSSSMLAATAIMMLTVTGLVESEIIRAKNTAKILAPSELNFSF